MSTISTFLLGFALWPLLAQSSELKNITEKVFGNNLGKLPLAFGDFNSDKLTDIFVIIEERNKISILLAQEQTFSSVLIR